MTPEPIGLRRHSGTLAQPTVNLRDDDGGVQDDPRIRFVNDAAFASTLDGFRDTETRVFELRAGISTKFEFFDDARQHLPLNPPLGRHYRNHLGEYDESWDALDDSLSGGLVRDVHESRVVIAWKDPGTLAAVDPEASRIAIDILLRLPADAADPGINGGLSKNVIVILGDG